MAYLTARKLRRRQFRHPRRAPVSGVCVVHTAENRPDFVLPDSGAENVANWITIRSDPGSYHSLSDSDTSLHLVEWGDEAFHDGTGTNPHSTGFSIACRADEWPSMPAWWRNGAIRNMAKAVVDFEQWLGREIPLRRLTAAEARAETPGFISHAELDPGRRSDPGAGFPWGQLFDEIRAARARAAGDDIPTEEEEEMFQLVAVDKSTGAAYLLIGTKDAYGVTDGADFPEFEAAGIGVAKLASGTVSKMLAGRTVH